MFVFQEGPLRSPTSHRHFHGLHGLRHSVSDTLINDHVSALCANACLSRKPATLQEHQRSRDSSTIHRHAPESHLQLRKFARVQTRRCAQDIVPQGGKRNNLSSATNEAEMHRVGIVAIWSNSSLDVQASSLQDHKPHLLALQFCAVAGSQACQLQERFFAASYFDLSSQICERHFQPDVSVFVQSFLGIAHLTKGIRPIYAGLRHASFRADEPVPTSTFVCCNRRLVDLDAHPAR